MLQFYNHNLCVIYIIHVIICG